MLYTLFNLLSLLLLGISLASADFVSPGDVDPKATYAITISGHDDRILDSKSGKLVVEKLEGMTLDDLQDDHGRRMQFPYGIVKDLDDLVNKKNVGVVYCVGASGKGGYLSQPGGGQPHTGGSLEDYEDQIIAIDIDGGIQLRHRAYGKKQWYESAFKSNREKVKSSNKATKFMITRTADKGT